ncbi:MAG: hypothetical protein M3O07_00735 [Pseudomonadota bacterium]|nr:hypothetical protein [Pseudomonadota bacterium]
MNPNALRAVALMALLCPLAAVAGPPADVEIFDRTSGRLLPVYWHAGERHVAGEPGHEYEIRLRNRTRGRVLAVTSVDGVNVLSGRTASADQGGYVMDPRGRLAVDGWRKNMDEVAAFYFTSLPDSYAARTGRPDNVGVIGVALFREQAEAPAKRLSSADRAEAPPPTASQESDRTGRMSGIVGEDSRLGTGHGQRLDSGAVYTRFERASETPEAVIRIFYDSERNLVAQGIIPRPRHHYAQQVPDPFPGGFVPDP